ncbi:MAG: class I SAM-dependent methyltransferase [Nitrospina sp.]|jgi:ubiquinone/menaquinone biosynthesis C-methylase UbiE|nr:class I SAM-dependent methyltransferase [Nitrospina sp.]
MSLIIKYFNEVAGKYNDKSRKGVWAFLRRLEATAVLKAMTAFEGMTCIELGCGAGYYTHRLASFNPSLLVAVDIAENMLEQLNDSRIKRVRADIEEIKFAAAFDRVLCAGAIEFLSDINKFFSNLKKLLSHSGKAVLLVPRKGVLGSFYKAFHRAHSVQVSLYGIDELKVRLDANHLKIDALLRPTPMSYVLIITHC